MKKISCANRGKPFESFIEYANKCYKRDEIAMIEKQYVEMLPIRNYQGKVVGCKVGEKSTVDYIGRFGKIPIAVEAKNTQERSIKYHAVEDHQARYLTDFEKDGAGIAMVLVSFNLKRFFAVPAIFWNTARDAWTAASKKGKRKAEQITITHNGQTWTTNGKASVRPEELLPEWECLIHGRYGLHYLNNAERYIQQQ